MTATVWDQNPRWIRIRVYMGPDLVEVTPCIVGEVSIGRDGAKALPSCDFTLYTPEMAYFAPGSFSAGPQPVRVTVTCWAPGFSEATRTEFEGIAEAPSNTGIYVPQGPVHAISSLSKTANTPGCLLIGGFAGNTRVDAIALFAEKALCPLTIDDALVTSGVITKRADLQGVTVLDLIAKWGTLDGWEAREKDGTLQLIPHDAIAGPTVAPAHAFNRGNFFSIAENAPSRPTTKRILSGQATYLAPDGTVTTTVGDTTKAVTILDGAIIEQVTEVKGDYTPLGTTPQTPLTNTVLTRETVSNTYEMVSGLPTAQLTARLTVREAWYCPFAAAGSGGSDTTFTDGSFRHGTVETFQEVERIIETFGWHVVGCYLEIHDLERSAWLARPVETSDDGAFTEAGTLWTVDGTTRLEAHEVYDVVEASQESEQYFPAGGTAIKYGYYYQVGFPYFGAVDGSAAYDSHPYRWRVRYVNRQRCNAGYVNPYTRTTERMEQVWKENSDGTKHQVRTVRWGMHLNSYSGSPLYDMPTPAGVGSSNTTDDVNEPLPRPPIVSPVERQFSLAPFVVTKEAIGTGFEDKTASGFNESLESAGEAARLLRWQERMDLADRLTISHPYLATDILRELDACTCDDPARYIAVKPSWVENMRLTLWPANGLANEVSSIGVDPYPADDPMSLEM